MCALKHIHGFIWIMCLCLISLNGALHNNLGVCRARRCNNLGGEDLMVHLKITETSLRIGWPNRQNISYKGNAFNSSGPHCCSNWPHGPRGAIQLFRGPVAHRIIPVCPIGPMGPRQPDGGRAVGCGRGAARETPDQESEQYWPMK